MEGERQGHQIRIRQIDEYRRTPRTGIALTFARPLAMKLKVTASASSRAQAYWLWLAFAAIIFAGGIGGAMAALHPGPLVACLGGGLILWGWLAARRSAARRKAKSVSLGNMELDGILQVETDAPDVAVSILGAPEARDILLALAGAGGELLVTEKRIALDIDRIVKTHEEFERALDHMVTLANLLTKDRP